MTIPGAIPLLDYLQQELSTSSSLSSSLSNANLTPFQDRSLCLVLPENKEELKEKEESTKRSHLSTQRASHFGDGSHQSNEKNRIQLKDVLLRFISSQVRAHSLVRKSTSGDLPRTNILCLGYRMRGGGGLAGGLKSSVDIECTHVNTTHAFFLASTSTEGHHHPILPWQSLLDVVGQDAFELLILERPCFLRLPAPHDHDNSSCNNYVQISGVSIASLSYANKRSSAQQDARVVKRKRILYNNACHRRIGLPFRHILNRLDCNVDALTDSIFGKGGNCEEDIRREGISEAAHAILRGYRASAHLFEAMNIFASSKDVTSAPTLNGSIEGRKGTKKRKRGTRGGVNRSVYSRLRPFKELPLKETNKKGRSECQVPQVAQPASVLLSTAILQQEGFRNTSQQEPSDISSSLESSFTSPTPLSAGCSAFLKANPSTFHRTARQAIASPARDLILLAVPIEVICSFIKTICRNCFSKEEIWRSRHNCKVFMSQVDRYLRLHKSESLTAADLTHRVRISELIWLQCYQTVGAKGGVALKQSCLERLLLWIFNDFINPLLYNSFYITECEGRGSELFFFRQR